jgi:tellurite resistance protein TerC
MHVTGADWAILLAFIGAKLILHWAHDLWPAAPEISTALSLAVIGGALAITTVASLIKSRRDPAARAHAGAVLGTANRHGDVELDHPRNQGRHA